MKKILFYGFALAAAALSLSSCSNTEDMIFDDSAANRLDKAKSEYFQLLCADGGKWSMEYFSNPDEHGYNYMMEFKPSGEVTISANNEWIGSAFKTEKSLWEVISDDGVVLSFNTYNSIFHVFSSPDNYEDATTSADESANLDHTGNGHLGDYEFIFIEHTDSYIKLKGKKRGHYIYMRRLPADTDPQAYIQECVNVGKTMFAPKIKNVYLTLNDDAKTRFIVANNSGIVSAYPEGGDDITQTSTANAILTPAGLRFMEPFEVCYVNGADSVKIQDFALQPDGSLLCVDDFQPGATISSGPLADLMLAGNTWRIDQKEMNGIFDEKINAAISELKKANGTVNNVELKYDSKLESFTLSMTARVKRGSNNVTATFVFLFDTQADGDSLKLDYKGCDSSATETYLDKMPSLAELLQALNGATLQLSAANRLATTAMTIALTDNDTAVVNLY